MRLLGALSHYLHDKDADHFEGGCADVSWLIERACSLAGISGVRAAFGTASRYLHAWLVVDGEIFDPRAHAEGLRYTNYRERPNANPEDFGCDTYDGDDKYLIAEAVAFLAHAKRTKRGRVS